MRRQQRLHLHPVRQPLPHAAKLPLLAVAPGQQRAGSRHAGGVVGACRGNTKGNRETFMFKYNSRYDDSETGVVVPRAAPAADRPELQVQRRHSQAGEGPQLPPDNAASGQPTAVHPDARSIRGISLLAVPDAMRRICSSGFLAS